MTQTTDLDRLLADWLADGPNRAPDQPIAAASQFVRAHPRRLDPLRFLRSDPMADRRRPSLALRPGLMLALLALVLAIVAAGVIGSQQNDRSIVPPSKPATSGEPASSPADVPTSAPSASPSASSPPALLQLDLANTGGNPPSVDVIDQSGLVVSGTSTLPPGSEQVDGIVVVNAGAKALRITWQGSPCDTIHRLTVDATATHLLLERPKCFGDAIARYLSVTLTFRDSVVAADVQASIVDRGGAGGAIPNWTAIGPDTAGNAFHVSIYDATSSVTSADAANDGSSGAALAANTGRVEGTPYDEIKLTWSRSACVIDERLTIDPTGRILTMTGTACSPSTPVFDRQLRLQFATPVDATQLLLFVNLVPPNPS